MKDILSSYNSVPADRSNASKATSPSTGGWFSDAGEEFLFKATTLPDGLTTATCLGIWTLSPGRSAKDCSR